MNKSIKVKGLVIVMIFMCLLPILNLFIIDNSEKLIDVGSIHTSGKVSDTKQWISNPNFDSSENWTIITGDLGDSNDLNAYIGDGTANYEIIGDSGTYEFYSDLTQDSNWNVCKNPDFPAYPDVYLINSSGACISHYWDEGADQSVAVNWNRTVEVPVDMSDYIITSASIQAVVNGSVQATPSVNGYSGAIDVFGDSVPQISTGDYCRYYVWISDPDNVNVFEIAYNQTSNLGQDDPLIETMEDTLMRSISEPSLIFFLTSVLSNNYNNFTITIGMRIWCEDNFPQDADNWKLMVIKSVNLTFTYEKKIDRFSTISFTQIGDKISDLSNYPINIEEANFNFKYKVDKLWNSSKSPNSEIQVLINNNKHTEAVKLSSALTSFQEAKEGGFDLTSLVTDSVNISIQIYLADEFTLDENITVTIDDVIFNISYVFIEPDIIGQDLSWLIYTLAGLIVGLVVIFTFYQTHFKYPVLVRKIRKLRKKIRKDKTMKTSNIMSRDEILRKKYANSIESLSLDKAKAFREKKIKK